ncbi:MAG: septum formation initiator family protein [Verrucomicrobiae bacterium]|nr:septum formation initiator family protein [Verrucomicrobiae bacterium]
MTRNRKRNANSLNVRWVFKLCIFLMILGMMGFFYVSQKNRTVFLGDEIKKLESKMEATRQRNQVLESQIANLKSLRVVQYKCTQWQLGLVQPVETQFIRVSPGRGSLQLAIREAAASEANRSNE